ncbi:glycosyltransferase family 2 protein [Anaerocolumna aminovalerica]|jgi:dolichol-phosphate mannosyltransferase|uniref:Glycosyltransferase involved in cell wall bisynthesis n=1 Tax=Anaerocolumna aminovalerica TaxID=1527 RepID=A0A1I5H9P9_9FIRM|nr:glycosyltransferase family 2 protein [Anaerocolumna aminovalerica]MBU5334079.1 glycosyltransferase family 2 protein [Anaerocolumna aminovalerica]MDU6265167.1 glycosyltransferase family 2 protein [Anaerocolumna aminovalerica]SFO44909.1 Glycosyltransferase involved in cell wall bisynthesis [Anaerocolumna aminovalerica]
MDKLYIVIPAYNEEENINSVIEDWYPIVERIGNGSKLVIIDDGSKDSTYNMMKKAAETKAAFEPVTKPNGGHGATVLYGYHYAIEAGADYVFQTDSDGQTVPEEFWDFWNIREQYDMVIGHRKGRQDGISRKVVTKVLKVVLKLCFGVTIKDANTPFRLMKAKTLSENMKLIPEDYNLSNVMVSVIYAKKKLPVKYLPVTFRERQGGVNSINIKKITKIGKQALKDFLRINKILANNI